MPVEIAEEQHFGREPNQIQSNVHKIHCGTARSIQEVASVLASRYSTSSRNNTSRIQACWSKKMKHHRMEGELSCAHAKGSLCYIVVVRECEYECECECECERERARESKRESERECKYERMCEHERVRVYVCVHLCMMPYTSGCGEGVLVCCFVFIGKKNKHN